MKATHDVALHSGAVSDAHLAWLVPAVLEGGTIVAAVLAWRRSRAHLRALPERTVLAISTVLASIVNAAHASGTSPLGVVLAATPPLVLVSCVELLLRHHDADAAEQEEKRRREGRAAARAARAAQNSEPRRPASSTRRAGNGASRTSAAARRAEVIAIKTERPDATAADIAEEIGISVSGVRRYLAEVRGAGYLGPSDREPE